jgi:hypothetical protein
LIIADESDNESVTNTSLDSDKENESIILKLNAVTPANECDPALASRQFVEGDRPIRPKINFPVTKKRKFSTQWYVKYDWVEYSIHRDAIFCFPCRKFSNNNGYALSIYVTTGM